ncbi:bacillithiol system redox-active protein YtxJ [Flavobacterium sp.]|uniref:bacillithiol system redox-active protein YtxJ n=1 Tax=Flavobacterium sp. TaxID=239 RepID=UPI0038FD1957
MSFLKNMFGNAEENNNNSTIKWNILSDLGELNEIINLSHDKPVVIFKHSTRCSVSRMALKQFENEFDFQDKVTPYFLDLIAFRDVSNEIANRFDVVHQSPQIILIKDGKAIYNASHSDIDANDLKEKLTY